MQIIHQCGWHSAIPRNRVGIHMSGRAEFLEPADEYDLRSLGYHDPFGKRNFSLAGG